MDGKACSNVKIYGRGVLSGARLHLRESHMVEAKSGADGIVVDGIVIADYSFFAVRLLGTDNEVSWTKIVGGWIYNCDGIAAYANSTIRNCFIWANDDNMVKSTSPLASIVLIFSFSKIIAIPFSLSSRT